VTSEEDNKILKEIQDRLGVKVKDLPDTIDSSTYSK